MTRPTTPYPGPNTLCEDCGYALKGLNPDGDCPECGLPIAASSPIHRTGPAWQTKPSPQAAFNIIIALMLRPGRFFRRMRADGTNTNPRLFLFLTAAAIGVTWSMLAWAIAPKGQAWVLIQGISVCLSVIVLTYIEALGVAYFARRRGWRVPMRLAERLACYSSIGWVPAAFVMWLAIRAVANGYIDRWMQRLLGTWEPWQSWALLVLIAAVAMMWFEVLVWIGVRQTKHANA